MGGYTMKLIILLTMLFLHIVDDYYLQGILAQMKQKSWWEKNAPDKLYKNDYKVALLEHAFSWTFMIMLPITVTMIIQNNYINTIYITFFIMNWILHTVIDHLKANKKIINLVVDQSCHILQIVVTWIVFVYKML